MVLLPALVAAAIYGRHKYKKDIKPFINNIKDVIQSGRNVGNSISGVIDSLKGKGAVSRNFCCLCFQDGEAN